MSKTLLIRHLPTELSFQDKEKLLKHFGAEKVWETKSKRNYVFAAFASEEQAKSSLARLHQLQIAERRLVVEYSLEKQPVSSIREDSQKSSTITKHIQEFLKQLNAWNPSVDFYQPPPVHIKYKYPDATPHILVNMIHALVTHKPLYVQTLHLMNKMSLESPFNSSQAAMEYFKENFRQFFYDEIIALPPEETESELSSDESDRRQQPRPALLKRKHSLPVTRKRPATVLATAAIPKAKKPALNQEEVFEAIAPKETKKISLVVTQDALQKPQEEPQVVGGLGTFQKPETEQAEEPQMTPQQPTITRDELLKNKLPYADRRLLPVFKNYHPGEPSMRLYIKNLAKTVTQEDVARIYRRYIENLSEEEQNGFDIRVMQEGRMKGQAFVTFPSERIAQQALTETNGYMLKEKPMVVQFARVANKKTIE